MGELRLWKFCASTGLKSHVDGVFAASEEAVESAVGQRVSLGDGSGDRITLEKDQFERLDADDAFVQEFLALKLQHGYNPLDWLD